MCVLTHLFPNSRPRNTKSERKRSLSTVPLMQNIYFLEINNFQLLMFSSKYFFATCWSVCVESFFFLFSFDRLHFPDTLRVTNAGMRFRTFVAARSAKTQLLETGLKDKLWKLTGRTAACQVVDCRGKKNIIESVIHANTVFNKSIWAGLCHSCSHWIVSALTKIICHVPVMVIYIRM